MQANTTLSRLRTCASIRTLAALLALALPAASAYSQELGRFFYTPQQRAAMDQRRASNIQAAAVVPVQVEDRLTVNGQVTRSSGPGTTWINGQPQEDRGAGGDPSRVVLPAGGEQPAITLKVGETLDRTKGETLDVLQGGTLSIETRK